MFKNKTLFYTTAIDHQMQYLNRCEHSIIVTTLYVQILAKLLQRCERIQISLNIF